MNLISDWTPETFSRLVLAAPDLFEACEEIFDCLGELPKSRWPFKDKSVIDKLDAAIAKARGPAELEQRKATK